jgi:hypothetical protein
LPRILNPKKGKKKVKKENRQLFSFNLHKNGTILKIVQVYIKKIIKSKIKVKNKKFYTIYQEFESSHAWETRYN